MNCRLPLGFSPKNCIKLPNSSSVRDSGCRLSEFKLGSSSFLDSFVSGPNPTALPDSLQILHDLTGVQHVGHEFQYARNQQDGFRLLISPVELGRRDPVLILCWISISKVHHVLTLS